MSERPNFLYIITDQQRADHVGSYGNKIVQTPNIDRFAQQGRVFNRAYLPMAMCNPCRTALSQDCIRFGMARAGTTRLCARELGVFRIIWATLVTGWDCVAKST